ncbi:hypothetical protein HX004_05230 [Myroides sp. 1354]|uniref:hypothetical protein n=1 Tax=unclassified Myroides TaxID=2642485 RepID=UPI002577CF2C|nr:MULTISPECIES: hypothetical protein [unclassified Myroides]MDM1044240.1 hypothetical protein [Myroides sp. R163-1]MDM1055176.1 hypothetical protein [Myroides sp. 1354]MDM1068473.1 hypothetical protein [Myroides sp. 1372]
MKKIGFLVAFFLMASAQTAFAQCAMCRAVLETEDGGVKAEAVNDGIVYLMIFPYLLVGFALYFSYKVYKKKKS